MEGKIDESVRRRRKYLLWLPVVVLPFTSIVFWVLGGGGSSGRESGVMQERGLNLEVPDANLKESDAGDKLAFYELAEKDSMKFGNTRPLEDIVGDSTSDATDGGSGRYIFPEISNDAGGNKTGFNPSLQTKKTPSLDDQLMAKLAAINSLVKAESFDTADRGRSFKNNPGIVNKDIDRLEEMMQYMNGRDGGEDPEIKQLEKTLDKLLDIQHPERVKQELQKQSSQQKQKVFPVTAKLPSADKTLLSSSPDDHQPFFYSLEPGDAKRSAEISVKAVVHEAQEMVDGSVLKLRLSQPVFINGVLVPAGNFIYGVASFGTERARVEITSVRYVDHLLPVKLEAYDADGLAGIFMPGLVVTEVGKQAADNSIQLIELGAADASLKAQAAAAGIQAAKKLAGKKSKTIRVRIKAGYQLYLKDAN